MELFVLGLVFGAATAQGKAVTKAVAKGYMAVSDKTREVVSTLREDMRGAIEEARVERDQDGSGSEIAGHEAEALALREAAAPVEPQVKQTAADPPTTSAAADSAKQTPTVMKNLAKRYMAMTEKTRDAVSGIRENVRDAIEEARYERELAAQRAKSEAEAGAAADTSAAVTATPVKKSNTSKSRTAKPKEAGATRSTRTKAAALKSVPAAAKPARSTRTKASTARAATPAPAASAPAPARRGRPRKSAAEPKLNASEALLEVAEIAADAL